MNSDLVLASGSATRASLLSAAGITHRAMPARIDEAAVKAALVAEGAGPRDIADALAEMKARKVASRSPGALVLGCDQVLAFQDRVLSKPESREDAREQLRVLSGARHTLLSAAVLYEDAQPVWRVVRSADLVMRPLSETFLDVYLDRAWPQVAGSVGAYQIEGLGARLFSRVSGDHFTILGLPLLELIDHLVIRGDLPS